MLRQLICLLYLLFSFHCSAQLWQNSYTDAQELAMAQDKNIVVVFAGSDWCGPCIKLERDIWNQAAFITPAKSEFVFYKADFPRRKANQLPADVTERNATLAERYNPAGSFPLVVVLTPSGDVLGQVGYQKESPQQYFDRLKSMSHE